MTPTAVGTFLVAALGVCLTVMNIVDKVIAYKKMIHSPEETQNKRLDNLEGRMDVVEDDLSQLVDQHKKTDEAVVLNTLALFDLINYLVDGGDPEKMRKTRNEMQAFVTKNGMR